MGFLTTTSLRTRRAFHSIAAAAVFTATSMATLPARAQDSAATLTDGTQPVVVATVASVNKLMRDVNYITGIAGQPQFGGIFAMMAGTYAQGMDMDQPIGVLVPMISGTPSPIVVLPTADIRPTLKRLEAQTGPVDELDDGTLVITINGKTLYISQTPTHAIASQNPAALKLVPASPTDLFKGMGNKFDLAVRLKVQQIPAPIRNLVIDQMRQGFEQAMAQQPNPEQARDVAEGSIDQIERLIMEADELNVGFNIDEANKKIGFDFSFSAVGGTQLAAIYGGQQPIPSRFASVIREDAAAYVHSATSISPEAIEMANTNIENSMGMIKGALEGEANLPPEQVAKIETYITRLTEIVSESMSEGRSDFGTVVLAGRDQFQAVMGTFVGDGNKVAALAKDLAKEVPDVPEAPKFKFDIGNFGGVTMHSIEVDVPEKEDEARKLFGEKIQIYLGTAPKAVYLSVGRDSASLLKEFITAGSSSDAGERPLVSFKMKLLPFLELAQSVEANDSLAAMIGVLSGSADKGEATIISESIPNGATMNLSIGEGLIRAIGAAAVAAQQQRMQAQPGF